MLRSDRFVKSATSGNKKASPNSSKRSGRQKKSMVGRWPQWQHGFLKHKARIDRQVPMEHYFCYTTALNSFQKRRGMTIVRSNEKQNEAVQATGTSPVADPRRSAENQPSIVDKNSYLIDLSQSNRTDFGRVDFPEQIDSQKVFSAVWALESQVNNGGFLQYFVSSDFDTANYAPTALRNIGALSCADMAERSLMILPASGLPDSQQACMDLVDSLGDEERERFDDLDSEFRAYPDNLADLLFSYVSSHPESFGPTPQ